MSATNSPRKGSSFMGSANRWFGAEERTKCQQFLIGVAKSIRAGQEVMFIAVPPLCASYPRFALLLFDGRYDQVALWHLEGPPMADPRPRVFCRPLYQPVRCRQRGLYSR